MWSQWNFNKSFIRLYQSFIYIYFRVNPKESFNGISNPEFSAVSLVMCFGWFDYWEKSYILFFFSRSGKFRLHNSSMIHSSVMNPCSCIALSDPLSPMFIFLKRFIRQDFNVSFIVNQNDHCAKVYRIIISRYLSSQRWLV